MAVLDAVGSDRAAILASLDSGPIAIMFAAMHPERVSSLILLNTTARYSVSPRTIRSACRPRTSRPSIALVRETWGSLDMARLTNPSLPGDCDLVRRLARVIRCSATPRTAAAQLEVTLRGDARQALSLVQAPTLVLHARENIARSGRARPLPRRQHRRSPLRRVARWGHRPHPGDVPAHRRGCGVHYWRASCLRG